MLRSIQTEMQSSRHIVKSGVQGSRVGRLAGERRVVGRALGRGRETERCDLPWKHIYDTHKKRQGTKHCVEYDPGFWMSTILKGLPSWLSGKRLACQCRRPGFDPWVRKIPCRRNWQPTPVFLPGKSHSQRSLVGYNPRDCKRVGHDAVT